MIRTIVLFVAVVSVATADTIYVNDAMGNDAWDGRCEVWDGGTCGPKKTIQRAIFVVSNGDEIIVADGAYTGEWNQNIDFGGRASIVRSANGLEGCVINCEGIARAFQFKSTATIRQGASRPGTAGIKGATSLSSHI